LVCCRVPHPQSTQTKHIASNKHGRPPFSTARAEQKIRKFDGNPNNSERRRVKRLSFFSQRDKNYAGG